MVSPSLLSVVLLAALSLTLYAQTEGYLPLSIPRWAAVGVLVFGYVGVGMSTGSSQTEQFVVTLTGALCFILGLYWPYTE
ncbi:hypothetical protein C483_07799 [Natrialba hulunbeirensis JCM 10989]|uniref:Uncharacterized protein n=1 Tax=Natrialba hulunbeirensis JCM 10989 TaxID=1227493 RepID=M0A1M8_9EURY|nr:hypothetical protein [Natrialba hulunbeirensis]ELY92509.1 hypothetical protein C483_07799 [Natrialba hulunbeirensis JCM 10989]